MDPISNGSYPSMELAFWHGSRSVVLGPMAQFSHFDGAVRLKLRTWIVSERVLFERDR